MKNKLMLFLALIPFVALAQTAPPKEMLARWKSELRAGQITQYQYQSLLDNWDDEREVARELRKEATFEHEKQLEDAAKNAAFQKAYGEDAK